MSILTKKKNVKKSKSKTNSKYKSKSISNSRTRKHFNKSKKNDLRTRKMRGVVCLRVWNSKNL